MEDWIRPLKEHSKKVGMIKETGGVKVGSV